MAAGKVLTGFSLPYVGVYANSGTTVSYTSTQQLARGVSVSVSIESADSNKFYADNKAAESVGGEFKEGTVTLTVDGLLSTAEKLIYGLPTADSAGFINYDDDQNIPYIGVGFIARYMSDGVTSYVPIVFPKVRFKALNLEAATQEEDIDWQTQELEADILRDDSAKHCWKKVGEGLSSESAALAKITGYLA